MVWFQCEDCGENLKKPKLPNHFRNCSATKLSCIDCGEIFRQQNVQGHNQCITEAEKYGPKGQGKVSNGTPGKPNKDSKQQPDVDVNVGLSERPPWFCSLCNTKATSKQTLLLHAEGKKHRAKARGYRAKQQPKPADESNADTKASTENGSKAELPDRKSSEETKTQDLLKSVDSHITSDAVNGELQSNKKRKHGACSDEAGDGEVIQAKEAKGEEKKRGQKKGKHESAEESKIRSSCSLKEDGEKKIKWKKLITQALKSKPEGALRVRKLRKLVLKSLQEFGVKEDEAQLYEKLEHKINSSSKFTVHGKYVRLTATD